MNKQIVSFIDQWATNWHKRGTLDHKEECENLYAMLSILEQNEGLIKFTTQENNNER